MSVAVPLSRRSTIVLALASAAGLMMLAWPLLLRVPEGTRVDPPFLFLALLPIVITVVLAEVSENTPLPPTDKDVMRTYELWVRTKSKRCEMIASSECESCESSVLCSFGGNIAMTRSMVCGALAE